MKNKRSTLLLLYLIFLVSTSFGQGAGKYGGKYVNPFGVYSVTAGIGIAYYMGDLRDAIDMKHLGMGPSLSIGGLYRVTEHFSARGELRFYQVSADQKYSRNADNNLSFRTRNPDINLGIQADLFSFNSQSPVNPYLFAGVGFTFLNPKASYQGSWYSLAPLTTEGEKYNRLPLVFTGGIGVSAKYSEKLSFGLELCNNFVQSDYLDDVSTFYPNPDVLPSDLARALSDRSPEIGLPARLVGGVRGGPKVKDSYLFLQVRATYLIGNRMRALERKRLRCLKL
tara:strand:- start:310 stop:1155 length:846 start_codon:yes stop_codon:yes gene_type:complete